MGIHQGEKLTTIIRKSGYSMTALAQKTNLSRTTLYNRLKRTTLSIDFLLLIGKALQRDLGKEFPEITKSYMVFDHLHQLKDDYINLLERHHAIMVLAFKTLFNITNPSVKRQVEKNIHDILVQDTRFNPSALIEAFKDLT